MTKHLTPEALASIDADVQRGFEVKAELHQFTMRKIAARCGVCLDRCYKMALELRKNGSVVLRKPKHAVALPDLARRQALLAEVEPLYYRTIAQRHGVCLQTIYMRSILVRVDMSPGGN